MIPRIKAGEMIDIATAFRAALSPRKDWSSFVRRMRRRERGVGSILRKDVFAEVRAARGRL